MTKVWYPYWSWESWQNGFYSGACKERSTVLCERLRCDFFLTEGLFKETAHTVFKEWPVCTEHFLTDDATNRIAWLGQVCSLWHDGLSDHYSYAYNKLEAGLRRKNNLIAQGLINEWTADRDNGGSAGIYRKVEAERLREGYTARMSPRVVKQRNSAVIQGNLFGDLAE